MKVVLVNPPSNSYRNAEEHLGVAYLKSFLRSNSFEADIVDGYLLGLSCNDIINDIVKHENIGIVGISPSLDSLEEAVYISAEIKRSRPDSYICWGGHLASFSAKDLLDKNPAIDCIIRGEGELTFLEVVSKIISKKDRIFQDIRGVACRQDDRIVFSKKRDLIPDLDVLPFPDRSNTQSAIAQGSVVQISGSRGCYGNCSFCSINSLYKLSSGKSWRGRSAGNIVDELEYLYRDYGFSMFKFVDDSFFGPDKNWKSRAIDIAEQIITRKLSIRFRISTRVNNVDNQVFSKLKQAGLYAVSVGVESGVQRALDTFKKGTTVAQNKAALQILNELDIIILMGFIGFDPYTSLDEVEENLLFLEDTLFCMSDLVSKPLYVHAEDAITKRLIKEGRITGRNFPNYTYDIRDKRVEAVLKYLGEWNAFNKALFYKISDPLTAPRFTRREDEVNLLKMHLKMREIDLGVYKAIVKMVRLDYTDESIEAYLKKCRGDVSPLWVEMDDQFNQLMNYHEHTSRR